LTKGGVNMGFYWLLVIFAFLLIEAFTMNLVTIWFAFGALCAFISVYFTDNLVIQLIVFLVFSIISLILTRPILKKYINCNIEKTNIDKVIGQIGIALTDIEPLKNGRVKVDGKNWMATSEDKIKENEKVEVLKIEGAKIIVRKKEK
jgi:membrane protein implicated in regulation of membrane protease activity